ncbi:hypothetical protein L7H23_08685 [Sphingopyxis sp. BSN-002]|uniref:hypothetical protein n=1 Tax=Sphingopyxis sp. BSN-002 TaxID=2911495 RepID=UPI001EDBF4CF|nr:hypothetical protein [Sphingopyxis sp. BSN-002]UKK86155.1 hypothetical protein L7H23_08685 [Sphingopyxis sp. BSN-002]
MLPKTARKLTPSSDPNLLFARMLSDALLEELGHTHRAVKTAMRWTGASESCVKLWLTGTHAPRGVHLVELMRHSDEVLRGILLAAGRQDAVIALEFGILRTRIRALMQMMDDELAMQAGAGT